MVRTVVAILVGPGIAATLISGLHLLEGHSTALIPLYYMVTYAFAIVPTALLVILLRAWSYTRFSHYVVAGLVVSVACTALFVLDAYRGVSTLNGLVEKYLGLWELLLVGPLTGGLVWFVSESHLLDAPFRSLPVDVNVRRS